MKFDFKIVAKIKFSHCFVKTCQNYSASFLVSLCCCIRVCIQLKVLTGHHGMPTSDWLRRTAQKTAILHRKVIMEDVLFKIKDNRSKWKKLNKISFSIVRSKLSPKMSLQCYNSMI